MVGEITTSTDNRLSANAHIKGFLHYFLRHNKDPNYALMISGPWGIGKTFLMKRYLRSELAGRDKPMLGDERFYYVSLNGLSTFDEIDIAVVEALFPPAQSKELKLLAKFTRAGLEAKIKTRVPDIKAKDILFKQGKKIFVFDDLERCGLPASKALGYINQFVEHDDCHVIILANEIEIRDEAYIRTKEKVVGKTLKIVPSLSEALSEYIKRLKFEELQAFLNKNAELLELVYTASGTSNLRILFQIISDFDLFYEAVQPKYRTPEAMSHVLGIFAALSFEMRSGALSIGDLKGRTDSWVAGHIRRGDKEKSPFVKACLKYAGIDLTSTALSDEVLDMLLVRGLVDPIAINVSLARSSFFVGAEEEAWRTLWHSSQRSDEQCSAALEVFRKQFQDREFIEPDLIMHVVGLKLFLAEAGIDGDDRSDVVRQCEAYLDDIYKSGTIKPYPPGEQIIDEVSSRGLGFFNRETLEYRNLLDKLQTLSFQAYEDRMPTKARELLNEMANDADLFERRILPTGGEDRRYDDEPIFASVSAEDFVERFLEMEARQQHTVASALGLRYRSVRTGGVLAAELPWRTEVVQLLTVRAQTLPAFSKDRILRFARYYLGPYTETDEETL